ncbi:MAG: hypothetical protein VW080_05785 [Flavobacteriaceae bacterium]
MIRNINFFLFFLGCIVFAQDPTPVVSYNFGNDKDYQEQIKALKAAYQNTEDLAILDQWVELAFVYKDWETALEVGQKALVKEPTASRYFSVGGAAGFRALEVSPFSSFRYVDIMKESFNKSVKLNPNSINALKAQADVYASLPGLMGGDFDLAIEYALKIIKLDSLEGQLALGEVYEKMKDYENASDTFENVFTHLKKTYPDCSSFFETDYPNKRRDLAYDLGRISATYNLESQWGLCMLNRFASSYELKDNIPEAWVYYQLARITMNNQDIETSKKYILTALSLDSDFEEALKLKKEVSP